MHSYLQVKWSCRDDTIQSGRNATESGTDDEIPLNVT